MSAIQDHDYCSKMDEEVPKESKVQTLVLEEAQNPTAIELIDKASDGMNIVSPKISESSLSPAHSTDSGIENGLDPVLTCISSTFSDETLDFDAFKDGEDLLDFDFLLGDDFKITPKSCETEKRCEKSRPVVPLGVHKSNKNLNTPLLAKKETAVKVFEPFASHGVLDEAVLLERNRKNAIAARENRQKKKNYLQNLEKEAAKLREENTWLKNQAKEQQITVEKFAEEVDYLKSVIANQSTISLLLKNISNTPGISFSSSLVSNASAQPGKGAEVEEEVEARRYITRKRSASQASCAVQSLKSGRTRPSVISDQRGGGVCLHVQKNQVSLELCSQCNKKSRR